MAQRLTTSFVNTNIPGAYPSVTVKSTPVGISSTGDIVIIGEAEGGADFTQDPLKDNFFTATQLTRVRAKYLKGPIVDAMAALISPSNDTNIQGSIGKVYIVKTNGGSKAKANVLGGFDTYGILKDKNFGVDGNKYFFKITQAETEVAPSITGNSLAPFSASNFDDVSFSVRLNGEAITTINLEVGSHNTLEDLATEINYKLPTGLSCSANVATTSLVIFVQADAQANAAGYGKSFELVDSTPGDLEYIGFSEELVVSSQEPEIQLTINRQDTNTNESFMMEAQIALTVGYDGTSAVLSISDGVLMTTVVGGTGSNLSITLSEFTTMSDLAAFINSQEGYSASSVASSNNLSPLKLDEVSAVGIATSGGFEAGRIKRAAHNFKTKVAESSVLDFESLVAAGLPSETVTSKFLGSESEEYKGKKGATTAADIANAIPALEGIKVNFVIPLFSRDASEDIADGLTDSSSTYTIDAINALVKSHVLAMSTPKMKRNRMAMLSKQASYSAVKAAAASLSNFRASMFFQKTSQVNSVGDVVEYQPWHTACVATGMQSAGFNKSLTNKFANVISFKDPSGFDSGNPGDVEDAIDAGLFFMQQETAGNKWVVDQTTYGFDTNFVYNSLQAIYMADVLAIQLSESLEKFAVGQSLADVTSAGIIAFISKKMEEYRKLKIIGASDDAPLGYKNVSVVINGPIAEVKLEAKLATAILFIPIELELSQIQSSASA
jgi:hypothetical protein